MADPDDPLTPLGRSTAQLHELFETLRRQGFAPEQALYLVAAIVTRSPGDPPKGAGDREEPP